MKNKNFTIISSNCNGGIIYHDLGLKFSSPFINLRVNPRDFLKLLEDLPRYLSYDLRFVNTDLDFPVAYLDDIKLYFMHYESEDEAREKWNVRKKRINLENLFILFSDRDGCTYEDLLVFDKIPYKNKAVLCHLPHPEIKSAYYIRGFESEKQVGVLSEYKSELFQIRYLDSFDYVSWLNGKERK